MRFCQLVSLISSSGSLGKYGVIPVSRPETCLMKLQKKSSQILLADNALPRCNNQLGHVGNCTFNTKHPAVTIKVKPERKRLKFNATVTLMKIKIKPGNS